MKTSLPKFLCAALITTCFALSQNTAFATDLCNKGEVNAFTCKTKRKKAKYLSLCGTKDWSATSGQLTYRYGKPGKVELAYPKVANAPSKAFTASIKQDKQHSYNKKEQINRDEITNSATVAFGIKDVRYEIFQDVKNIKLNDYFDRPIMEDKWINNQKTSGIRITLPSKKVITIKCEEQTATGLSSVALKVNPPPKIADACLPKEKSVANCNRSGKIASLCKNKSGNIFARIQKGKEAFAFKVNPSKKNPIKLSEEFYVRDIGNRETFESKEGSVATETTERYQGITFKHTASKTTIDCSSKSSLTSIFPSAATKMLSRN